MSISILNTGTANISSLIRCLKKIGINPILTKDIDECISSSNKIILPGIGNMKYLINFKKKLGTKLLNFTNSENKYLLGICVGAQVMMDYSEESGDENYGLINGNCKKIFDLTKINLNVGYRKIIHTKKKHPLSTKLFENIPTNSKFYFLHKYYIFSTDDNAYTLKTSLTNKEFDCLLIKKNLIAVQFHPELSKKPGELFLKNFSEL
jgi:glutamine amidotransferase